MTQLGSLLTSTDLPSAELCCARIDGEVVAVGEGWCPVDHPVGPASRAAAAALLVPEPAIAERLTAAWIFGIVPEPVKHQFCLDLDRRAYVPPSVRIQVREVRCRADDTRLVGTLRVTTPLRTAADLARHGGGDEEALPRLIADVLAYGGIQPNRLLGFLEAHAREPYTARARRRLRQATGVGVTGG